MIAIIGVILLIVGVVCWYIDHFNKQIDEYNQSGHGGYNKNKITDIGNPWFYWGIGLVVTLLGVANPISINDAGNRQVIQTIQGDLWVRFEPGMYLSGPFSKVTTYPNNFTVQISAEEYKSPNADFWFPRHKGTFSEGDEADLSHTVKWDFPVDEPTMINLHKTYNSVNNIATTTISQFQKQTASYSCQRMSSEEHYSGGESQLNQYFQDQLRRGQVLLITETKTQTQSDGSTKTYIEVNERLDQQGRFLRNEESIADILDMGMSPSFASIDDVTYDEEIYVKLQTKIKFAADEANSKQELVAAQQQAETAKVQGEKMLAEKRATEEAKKLEAVIKAQKEYETERLAALKAGETAKRIEAEGRAKAAANRALVQAGLTPQEQAEWDYKTSVEAMRALAGPNGLQLPDGWVVIGGGQGKGQQINPFDAVGLQSFIEIQKSMNKKQ